MTGRLKPGDRVPGAELRHPDGRTVRTDELCAHGPVIIAFLRHFG